ncbi:MAG TPA: hypothetical protein VM470_03145 [Acidimicrobiia bacterium]|nr:hypothetical protein [Acidimicrobiia bacterium]
MKHDEVTAWFTGRLPDGWAAAPVEIEGDRDEIIVTVPLSDPAIGEDASEEARATARQARIDGFREDTREQRMKVAREAERRFDRKVSWGARSGDDTVLFTHLAAPAMTRLRLKERKVLDTLVESGVARSRAHALAWCVRLVGEHEADWLAELRNALSKVEELRSEGPTS